MAVFVFGGQAPETVEFPVMFIFKSPGNLPVQIPFRPLMNSLFLIPQLAKSHPELLRDDTDGAIVYHHFLQKAIIETLAFRYRNSWQTKILRFDTSTGREMLASPIDAASPGRKLSPKEIEQAQTGNKFAEVNTVFGTELTLPPETTVRMQPPHVDPRVGEISSIVLDNPFIRVTIQTRQSEFGVLFGGFRLMLGLPNDTNTDLRQANFVITVRKEFKSLRTGHPDMQKYKAWADQLTGELQNEFDEQRIWAKAKEDYLFSKQLPIAQSQPFGVLPAPENH
jgi:hypothetical protein